MTDRPCVLRLHLELSAGPEAPEQARAWLRRGEVPADLLGDALLVLSELVTNSLQHADAGETIEVHVHCWEGAVRIEVHDCGPGITAGRIAPPAPEQKGGRGLYLIQELSERWGAERSGGSLVWAELRSARFR